MKQFGEILHGLYTILATYLLGWVAYFALVGFGFHAGTDALVGLWGFERPDLWWRYAASTLGADPVGLRFVVYVTLHVALLGFAWRYLRPVKAWLERSFDTAHGWFRARTRSRPAVRTAVRGTFTAVVTLVLIPFVLQPTMVADWRSSRSWFERTANLADGTASRYVVDSVVGGYRRWFVDDVTSEGGVSGEDFERSADRGADEPEAPSAPPTPTGDQPMMDRWDPVIERAVEEDPERFAQVKAFMWVESAGRQFAVSHTGCAGLMQFCSGTARSAPFRKVFGTGTVYTCDCDGQCDPPDHVSEALETGEREEIAALDEKFPCDLTDARFRGDRSIRAGKLYIDQLAEEFGENLHLMYIGYNSGPAVARNVWHRTGKDPEVELDEIEPHLAAAMRPHFPGSAQGRARSLVQTHLPKLQRAYRRYRDDADELLARPIRQTGSGSGSSCSSPAPSSGSLGVYSKVSSSSSSSKSTSTLPPCSSLPNRISSAIGRLSRSWIVRSSGRAPRTSSYPSSASHSRAPSVSSTSTSRSES